MSGNPPKSAIFISGVIEMRVAPWDHGMNFGNNISAGVQDRGRMKVGCRIFIVLRIIEINTSRINCKLP